MLRRIKPLLIGTNGRNVHVQLNSDKIVKWLLMQPTESFELPLQIANVDHLEVTWQFLVLIEDYFDHVTKPEMYPINVSYIYRMCVCT